MSQDLGWMVTSAIVGIGLGIFYFGGLWLTVKNLPTSRNPELLAFGSFAGRTAVVLVGFYLVMAGHWERLLLAALGFLVIRATCIRMGGTSRRSVPTTYNG